MGSLHEMVKRMMESFGLLRQNWLNALRDQIRRIDEETFTKELQQFKTGEELRILWEAGLNATFQRLVIARLEELRK
jgi:hypothetical protein